VRSRAALTVDEGNERLEQPRVPRAVVPRQEAVDRVAGHQQQQRKQQVPEGEAVVLLRERLDAACRQSRRAEEELSAGAGGEAAVLPVRSLSSLRTWTDLMILKKPRMRVKAEPTWAGEVAGERASDAARSAGRGRCPWAN